MIFTNSPQINVFFDSVVSFNCENFAHKKKFISPQFFLLIFLHRSFCVHYFIEASKQNRQNVLICCLWLSQTQLRIRVEKNRIRLRPLKKKLFPDHLKSPNTCYSPIKQVSNSHSYKTILQINEINNNKTEMKTSSIQLTRKLCQSISAKNIKTKV